MGSIFFFLWGPKFPPYPPTYLPPGRLERIGWDDGSRQKGIRDLGFRRDKNKETKKKRGKRNKEEGEEERAREMGDRNWLDPRILKEEVFFFLFFFSLALDNSLTLPTYLRTDRGVVVPVVVLLSTSPGSSGGGGRRARGITKKKKKKDSSVLSHPRTFFSPPPPWLRGVG